MASYERGDLDTETHMKRMSCEGERMSKITGKLSARGKGMEQFPLSLQEEQLC